MDVIRLIKTCIYLTGTFPTDLISSYFLKSSGEISLLFCAYFLVLGRATAPSPQEVRRTLIKIFVLAKRRYYTSFWLPGPETLFPIDLHGERVVCKSLDNFF